MYQENNMPEWLREYQSVSEVNQIIERAYRRTSEFQRVLVWGEVTDYRKPSGGNYYFKIKETKVNRNGKEHKYILACIMWGNVAASMHNFKLRSGIKVAIEGYLDYYPESGETSLKVRHIQEIGEGDAAKALMQLRAKLEAEGIFDIRYKKPIPTHPSMVGIVTSKNGEAIKDICKTAKDKNPYVQLVLYHVYVQGKHAVDSIVHGIQELDRMGMDTIIVGRGGGSDEELSVYNNEKVVRAVFQMKTPVISAVGHEGNWSLTDYAADWRESTPTKAAMKAFPDVLRDLKHVQELYDSVQNLAWHHYIQRKLMLDAKRGMLEGFNPYKRLQENKERLVRYHTQMQEKIQRLLEDRERRLQLAIEWLKQRIGDAYEWRVYQYEKELAKLHGYSPTTKLINGYGYISKNKVPVTAVEQVEVGDNLRIRIHDGKIYAKVLSVKQITPEQQEERLKRITGTN